MVKSNRLFFGEFLFILPSKAGMLLVDWLRTKWNWASAWSILSPSSRQKQALPNKWFWARQWHIIVCNKKSLKWKQCNTLRCFFSPDHTWWSCQPWCRAAWPVWWVLSWHLCFSLYVLAGHSRLPMCPNKSSGLSHGLCSQGFHQYEQPLKALQNPQFSPACNTPTVKHRGQIKTTVQVGHVLQLNSLQ